MLSRDLIRHASIPSFIGAVTLESRGLADGKPNAIPFLSRRLLIYLD